VVAIVVFAVASSSACLVVDFGEFTSGADAGALDAANDGNPDASTTSDAAFTTDAFDAMIDAGGGDAFSCEGRTYLLCATFDDGKESTGFGGTSVKAGGSISADNVARSGPFALHTQLPAMTDPTHQYALVFQTFTGTKSLRVGFDVKITSPVWAANDRPFELFSVDYGSTANETYVFRLSDGMTVSQEQNGVYTTVETLPYGVWTRVTFEIVPTSPKGSMRMYYDGRIVLALTTVPFDPPASQATTTVFIGLGRFDPPGPAIDVHYDSVLIEEIP
jgi:hypothetical protein